MDGRRSDQHSPPRSLLSDTDYGDTIEWNTSEPPAKEQDWHLPIANVGRIMKKSLPANAKISKEAKGIVQECVSEFIGFITGEASDKCQREKRKTINGDDVLWAMTTLGFENYALCLNVYMNNYRETEGVDSIAMQGDRSPVEENNTVARGIDQSPMEMVTGKNSPKEGLLNAVSPNPKSMAMNMHLSGISPEFYSLGEPMAYGYVSGGNVGGYGQDHSRLCEFSVSLGENNEIGDANVAAALAASRRHVVQRL